MLDNTHPSPPRQPATVPIGRSAIVRRHTRLGREARAFHEGERHDLL